MGFSPEEILETINMINHLHFDIRTVTLGISLLDCGDADPKVTADNIYKKILSTGKSWSQPLKRWNDSMECRLSTPEWPLLPSLC